MTKDSRLTDYGQNEESSASAADTAEADTEEADAAKADTEEASTEDTAAVSSGETAASSAQNTVEADESDPSSSNGQDTSLSTYAWGTYTCNRCDSGVDRVWRDDGGLVCPSCKEW
ncbi:hypothetical protein ACFQO4_09345 [Saliphagus sp. GCM10025334]